MTNSETKRSYWYLHIAAIIVILIVLYLLTTLLLMIITRHNREYTVPDFTHKTLESALVIADDYHLRLDVTDSVYINRLSRGMITKQKPKPGSKVKKNRRILLTINALNPKQTYVPSLIGYSLRQAKTELISQGLGVGKLIYQEDMATNNVLAQMYEGKEIEPKTIVNSGTEIDLVLGMNKSNNQTYIPPIFGYKFTAAKDIMIDNSLNIGQVHFDETVSTYSDSLDAVIYKLIPAPSDSIRYKMGRSVHLFLTLDESKVPIIEEEVEEVKNIVTKVEVKVEPKVETSERTIDEIIDEIMQGAEETNPSPNIEESTEEITETI